MHCHTAPLTLLFPLYLSVTPTSHSSHSLDISLFVILCPIWLGSAVFPETSLDAEGCCI